MPFDFNAKRVLVAGASRGIGRAIALQFAVAGADVAVCARGAATLEEARADIARHGRRVHAMTCDLADAASIAAWVERSRSVSSIRSSIFPPKRRA